MDGERHAEPEESPLIDRILNGMHSAFEDGYRAIGEITFTFQQLENTLGRAVSFFIHPGPGSIGDIVACELSFKQLVVLGYSLFCKYKASEVEENLVHWKAILARACAAEQKRNELLHSNFAVSFNEKPILTRQKRTAKYKKGLSDVVEALDATTLAEYRDQMSTVNLEIEAFMSAVFPSWQEGTWEP